MIMRLKQLLKKELLFYIVILIVLALVMHSDLLTSPLARLDLMKEKGNYFHPFMYSFVLYSVILFLRTIINVTSKIFEKKSK